MRQLKIGSASILGKQDHTILLVLSIMQLIVELPITAKSRVLLLWIFCYYIPVKGLTLADIICLLWKS